MARNLGFVPDHFIQPHLEAHLRTLDHIASYIESDIYLMPALFLPFGDHSFDNLELLQKYADSSYVSSFYDSARKAIPSKWIIHAPCFEKFKEAVDEGIYLASRSRGPEDLVQIDGVDFAYAPLFDMALTRKCSKSEISSSPSLLSHYRTMLAAYIASYRLVIEFLTNSNQKYCSITGYNDYGPMSAARRAAHKAGIQYTMITNSVVSGFIHDRIIVYNKSEFAHKLKKHDLYSAISDSWYKYAHPDVLAFGEAEITSKLNGESLQCYSPLLEKRGGSHQLDQAVNQINRDKKLIALFVSSNDEANAIRDWLHFYGISSVDEKNKYNSQFEWLEDWLCNGKNSNIQFILRMHPRIGKDHRGGNRSHDYRKWLDLGARFEAEGHIVIYPESDISSYLLPYLVTHSVVSWSSIGQELALLGFPVSQSFSQPYGILNYPENPSFLPYRPLVTSYSDLTYEDDPRVVLETIGSSSVYYGWYRGLSSYRLFSETSARDWTADILRREVSSFIVGRDGFPEEMHFGRFCAYYLPESISRSDVYPNLGRYLKIALSHAIRFNRLIQKDVSFCGRSKDFLSECVGSRISVLTKAVSLIQHLQR
jgi:hypothetical protein